MTRVKFAALTALALFLPQIAEAQQKCAPRALVLEKLSADYGESRQAMGLASQSRVMEMFASSETGSWTITVTMPNGMTCLVASGQSYETLEETVAPAGIAG